MPSLARTKFSANKADVDRLLEIHKDIAGDDAGRKYGVEVLNKSGIVLVCAFWEGYIEDVCNEAVKHLVTHVFDHTKLPKEPKKLLATALKEEKNELAVWGLAGDGWKALLQAKVQTLTDGVAGLNTPKHEKVQELFNKAVGLKDVTDAWKWQKMSTTSACAKLDAFVSLRGAIAHRGKLTESVKKKDATDFLAFVELLIDKTDAALGGHLLSVTGVSAF